MKFAPLPEILPKECIKASKILQSFVEDGKGGLDGVVPRYVLETARGFAILSVIKAGFLFSARAGSGLVIARLDDGTWSAPSAIGTAGMGFGSQAGAEMTDYLFVLNSRSAVRSFMSAGSVTLGGNLSVALGPIGRTGEASGSVNTTGQTAAMYSYAKTKGLFGGVSIEGSVIVERQDANCQAYDSDVSAQMILSGVVPVPPWADGLIKTIEKVTGHHSKQRWVRDSDPESPKDYAFGGMGSPGSVIKSRKNTPKTEFPPASWGPPKETGSYFDTTFKPNVKSSESNNTVDDLIDVSIPDKGKPFQKMSSPFDTSGADIRIPTEQMKSPFEIPSVVRNGSITRPQLLRAESEQSAKMKARASQLSSQLEGDFSALKRFPLLRSRTSSTPQPPMYRDDFDEYPSNHDAPPNPDPNLPFHLQEVHVDLDKTNVELPVTPGMGISSKPSLLRKLSKYSTTSDSSGTSDLVTEHKRAPSQRFKAAMKEPLDAEAIGRAIVRFDFTAAEAGDLTMKKGDIVTILEKSESVDDWWKGRINDKEGIFPANFVEVLGQRSSDLLD